MFSGFFGKGNSADKTPPKEAPDSRGLEVVEDDPDTAWSMWDNALAEQDSRFPADIEASAAAGVAPDPIPAPRAQAKPMPPVPGAMQATVPMSLEPHEPTQPLDLQEKTLEQRKNDALDIVDLHHHRIANTIRTMWGYKECSIYINKLVMAGGDGMGHARIGFNMEAVQAMLALIDLHDAQYGPPDTGGGLGFADPTIRSGIEGSRRG